MSYFCCFPAILPSHGWEEYRGEDAVQHWQHKENKGFEGSKKSGRCILNIVLFKNFFNSLPEFLLPHFSLPLWHKHICEVGTADSAGRISCSSVADPQPGPAPTPTGGSGRSARLRGQPPSAALGAPPKDQDQPAGADVGGAPQAHTPPLPVIPPTATPPPATRQKQTAPSSGSRLIFFNGLCFLFF